MPAARASNIKERLGIHRSLEPLGALPQQAHRINPALPITSKEILIDVSCLNVDSASFHQFYSGNDKDEAKTSAAILKVIEKHNGNITRAAKELGLTRTALYRRLSKYDI